MIRIVTFALVPILLVPSFLWAADPLTERIGEAMRARDDRSASLAEHYEAGAIELPVLEGPVTRVTMVEAVSLALERNLQLEAATYDARSAAATLRGAYGLYDPVLSASITAGDQTDLFNSFFAPLSITENQYRETSIALIQKLPIGTELTLSTALLREDAVPPPGVNPSYDSQVRLSLLQPLLNGFGRTVTEQQIIFAAQDRQIALQDLREKAFAVVAAVRNAYLDTLQARYELSYRETSVELARRIVRENAARVEAGVLAPVEKLEAEVGLQTRERLLLDAQRAFSDALDRFNLLLDAKETTYLPVIQPFTFDFETSEDAGVEAGLLKRPDMIRRLKEIEKIRTERSIARNNLLPELDLFASYSQNGLNDSAGDSFDDVRDGDLDSWEVGVSLTYALGSVASRNALKRTEIELRRERALLQQLHNEVRNEIRAAIRNISVSRKKTEVADKGHELALEKLRILLRSRDVGLVTTRDVLDGEEDLASARTDQIASVADYFRAITEYLRVTGTLLENEQVVFRGDAGPDGTDPLFQRQP